MIASDWSRPLDTVNELAQAGVEWLHWDAMDGHFVPNITLGPMFLQALRPHSPLHFDAHLMLQNPGDYVDAFVDAGADSISVHVEGNTHLHRVIGRIKERGKEKERDVLAGAVLNPATPVEALSVMLPELDYVLVMSVNPGFSGQKFLPLSIQKIAQLSRMREERGLNFLIQVDGGMSPQTALLAVRAGADVLVCGSNIFSGGASPAQNVRAMREAIESALNDETEVAR
jgi:ribulose-phosphate 3-epimerase